MDDVISDLLRNRQPDSGQLRRLLDQLGWESGDPYVCLNIANQENAVSTIQEHSLHSDLFRYFPNSYVLLENHRQYVILNMRRLAIPYTMLRHTLAPLCRDYLLYAGISSPIQGIQSLHVAFTQAQIALDACFRQRGDRWIWLFSQCALTHILENFHAELTLEQTLSPALYALRDYDREHGTPYFETLREYLLCERDIPKTSQTLIIHRTTLLYRLKKIESLVNLSLDDPGQRLYLLLSLYVMDRIQSGGVPRKEQDISENPLH